MYELRPSAPLLYVIVCGCGCGCGMVAVGFFFASKNVYTLVWAIKQSQMNIIIYIAREIGMKNWFLFNQRNLPHSHFFANHEALIKLTQGFSREGCRKRSPLHSSRSSTQLSVPARCWRHCQGFWPVRTTRARTRPWAGVSTPSVCRRATESSWTSWNPSTLRDTQTSPVPTTCWRLVERLGGRWMSNVFVLMLV